MTRLINNGATRKDRAESIVRAVLEILPPAITGVLTKQKIVTAVEEVLAEIERPKTGECC